ncbi:esterase/lipase family protein [Nocardia transvalensis]|uniref:esterase/lipase family protein n=1 Tax=Nocardia transvalensis TaxID=37333 RepID=UPI0018961B5A|nr:alpha/beta fold hydrolase [Nocardia transvalensis]MBF6330801.1 alpha/beta fold hydrolase [Nocardia transvalensis]
MRHSIRRDVVRPAVLVCTAVLFTVIGAGAAHSDAGISSTPEAVAEYVAAGLHPTADGRWVEPIVDSGSGSGSAASFASDARVEGPEMSTYPAAFGYGLTHPDAAPPGANRWDCTPGAAHPRPVVLVHGTWLNAYDDFAYLSPRLARAGFCVFAFNYGRSSLLDGGGVGPILPGRFGVGPIAESARQLADFVERVRAATHTDRVDVVAHSQGGPVTDQYLKFEGGADKVDRFVSLGATHHGTSLLGIATLGRVITNLGIDMMGFYRPIIGPANIEQAVGSEFVTRLNANGDTVPGVSYTVVATRYDQVMNPLEWAFLQAGPGATVENITLQDGCEQDMSDHLSMMYSPRALSITLRALDPVGYPVLDCSFNAWLIGGGGQ